MVFSARTTRPPGQSPAGFTAPLNKGLIPQLDPAGFATGALDPCTVDGKVYCLRNDLAQIVLWYNEPLMKQWGYQVPTTWEEYQALGRRWPSSTRATSWARGDTWTPEIYMWASQCGANQITGLKAVTVNVTSAELHAHGLAARHADQGQDDVDERASSAPDFDKNQTERS